jgi:Bacteriophage clamp loader A subunit
MIKKNKPKGPTLFDFLNQIYLKVEKYPYDKKIAPAYMLSMWLSHDPYLISYVEKINRLQFILPDDIIYQYYMNVIPKGRRYIKWVKKTEEQKKIKEEIDKIMEGTNLSRREAKMILSMRG